jgi:hypothetical protein
MRFSIIDAHLHNCQSHLDATNSRNTEVESYLVQFLLTRIVAEYEIRIAVLVERRCSRMRDAHVKKFAKRSAKDATRRFNIGDLAGVLNRFGDDYKTSFHSSILSTPAHVAWDNIYNNRMAVAHGSGAQMSFSDLLKNYGESLVVLDQMVVALCLKPKEIRDLT